MNLRQLAKALSGSYQQWEKEQWQAWRHISSKCTSLWSLLSIAAGHRRQTKTGRGWWGPRTSTTFILWNSQIITIFIVAKYHVVDRGRTPLVSLCWSWIVSQNIDIADSGSLMDTYGRVGEYLWQGRGVPMDTLNQPAVGSFSQRR